MVYNVWGSFSTGGVGPNAPLVDSCAPSKQGLATTVVEAWTAAEFPAHQIALGVAAYGHSFRVDASTAKDSSGNLAPHPPFIKTLQPLGDGEKNEINVYYFLQVMVAMSRTFTTIPYKSWFLTTIRRALLPKDSLLTHRV